MFSCKCMRWFAVACPWMEIVTDSTWLLQPLAWSSHPKSQPTKNHIFSPECIVPVLPVLYSLRNKSKHYSENILKQIEWPHAKFYALCSREQLNPFPQLPCMTMLPLEEWVLPKSELDGWSIQWEGAVGCRLLWSCKQGESYDKVKKSRILETGQSALVFYKLLGKLRNRVYAESTYMLSISHIQKLIWILNQWTKALLLWRLRSTSSIE